MTKEIEEKRFQASAMILAGMCANYHNGMFPPDGRIKDAIYYADCLIKALMEDTELSK